MKVFKIKNEFGLDVYHQHQVLKSFFPSDHILYRDHGDYMVVYSTGNPVKGECPVSNLTTPDNTRRFQLRVNLQKRDKNTGKRVPILSESDARKWLSKRSDDMGIELLNFQINFDGARRGRKKGKYLTFNSVNYAGDFIVKDENKFQKMIASGVGSAKAFGFGCFVYD